MGAKKKVRGIQGRVRLEVRVRDGGKGLLASQVAQALNSKGKGGEVPTSGADYKMGFWR